MIKLDIKPYCHECADFEPVVVRRAEMIVFDNKNEGCFGDTVVQCAKRGRCNSIYNCIKKEYRGD